MYNYLFNKGSRDKTLVIIFDSTESEKGELIILKVKKIINASFSFIFWCVLMIAGCSSENGAENTDSAGDYEQNQIDLAYSLISQITGMRSLVISFNGEIVGEEYFNGTDQEPDSLFDVRSVTKSITSTLIGIALDKGYLNSLDQKMSEFITPLVSHLDEVQGNTTIRQLLMMTAGHNWHEIGGYSEFSDWCNAPDQLEYIIQKPIVHTPGTVFNYSDGTAHLVSAIISQASGMSASEFARIHLFEPLGLGGRYWYDDNRGICYGGVGLCIGPMDMIRIGEMILNQGVYNGKRIVSAEWINQGTSRQISTHDILPHLTGYGYFWWTGSRRGHEFTMAMGYGGQFLVIIPDIDLVIAATCNYRGLSSITGQNWESILGTIMNTILPAFG